MDGVLTELHLLFMLLQMRKLPARGERFAPMNLSGQTLVLKNADALGVNNRRCYKNVPFYVSSRPYGLLILTSAHTRLLLADISTRVNQAMIEDGLLDFFVIDGKNTERILYNYRLLAGFPHDVPLWSYDIWMGRMTYFTAEDNSDKIAQVISCHIQRFREIAAIRWVVLFT